MLVLRTARETAAQALGTTLDQIRPETSIRGVETAVLDALHRQVMKSLTQERPLDPIEVAQESAQSLDQMRRELGAHPAPTVALAAILVTRATVRLLLASRLDVKAGTLEPELHLAHDLGADSLTRVDLVLLLEEALEVSVPDDSISLVQTVGDAQLFSVLYDRTREEIIISLGDVALDLSLDTPLANFGDPDGRVAIAAAARALDADLPLCHQPCRSLKEAVRLAYLAEKVRTVLARASGREARSLGIGLVPVKDLGLDAEMTRHALAELARSLDIEPSAVNRSPGRPLAATICALAEAALSEAPRKRR